MARKKTLQEAQAEFDEKFPDSGIVLKEYNGVSYGGVVEYEGQEYNYSQYSAMFRYGTAEELLKVLRYSRLNAENVVSEKSVLENVQAQLDEKFPDSGVRIVTYAGYARPCKLWHEDCGEVEFSQYNYVKSQQNTEMLLLAMKRKASKSHELQDGPRLKLHSRSEPLDDDEYVKLRFFKDIKFAAGSGAFEQEDYNGYYLPFGKSTLYRAGVQAANAVCFTVQGSSMWPALPDGTTIGVDLGDKSLKDGQIYAFVQDGLLRVKVLHLLPSQKVRLYSYNSVEYPAEVVDFSEIDIVGRVFWWSVLV